MDALIPQASLKPGDLPPEELVDRWQQSIAPMLQARSVDDASTHAASHWMKQYHLGNFLFIDCGFPAQRYRRDGKLMARHDDADHMTLQMYVRGGNKAANGGSSFTLGPGNVYAVSLADEVDAQSTDAEVSVLVLPHQLLLEELPQLIDARGALFAQDSVSGRVFVDYLMSLRAHLPQARLSEVGNLRHSLIGLLDALVLHGDMAAVDSRSALAGAICRYIDLNLGDPDLGPDRICGQFKCSRATLYRLFTAYGGVREHIRRRRLMACFKAITSAKHAHRGVFDIALDFGFVSPSHFSNLFREYFDLSPSEARNMAGLRMDTGFKVTMPSGGTAQDDGERMWEWAKSLTAAAYKM